MKWSRALVMLLIILAHPAAAQSRGTVSDTRLIIEKNGSPPDTFLLHTISSGFKSKSEYQGGKNPVTPFGAGGSVQIMTLSDSEVTMDFLDPATMTYTEIKPGAMMRGAREMMKSMGSDMTSRMKMDSTAIDSLGDGGVIAGYPTQHYRMRFSAQMSMALLGDSIRMSMHDTMDMYLAPALKNIVDSADTKKLVSQTRGAFSEMIPDMGPMMAAFSGDAAKLAKAGMAVKTVNSMTTGGMGRVSTQRMTTEVLKIERAVIPDSTFAVPANYKKIDPMIRMKRDSSRTRTSQSPRTPS